MRQDPLSSEALEQAWQELHALVRDNRAQAQAHLDAALEQERLLRRLEAWMHTQRPDLPLPTINPAMDAEKAKKEPAWTRRRLLFMLLEGE